jgi:hypothetical protein
MASALAGGRVQGDGWMRFVCGHAGFGARSLDPPAPVPGRVRSRAEQARSQTTRTGAPMAQMASSRSGAAFGSEARPHGSAKDGASPRASQAATASVPQPPRDRPRRCRFIPPLHPQPSGARARRCHPGRPPQDRAVPRRADAQTPVPTPPPSTSGWAAAPPATFEPEVRLRQNGPNRSGRLRHSAPSRRRQTIPSTTVRSSRKGRPVPDRAASKAASSAIHSASASSHMNQEVRRSQLVVATLRKWMWTPPRTCQFHLAVRVLADECAGWCGFGAGWLVGRGVRGVMPVRRARLDRGAT